MSELKTWFHTPPTTGESRLRLFCFPYAGGSASIFHHWPKTLASGIEVYALNLPGRAYRMREKPFTRMPQLVEAVAAAIKPALDVPFVLFGHSLGALMAFEVARALRAHQLPQPAGLIVSARVGPQFGPSEEPIYSLPRNAFVSELQRRYGPTVDLFKNPEVLDLVLPALRSDFEVLDHYVYSEQPALDIPVLALIGTDDPAATADRVGRWAEITTGAFASQTIAGGHFFIDTAREQVVSLISATVEGWMSS